jgi:hypothetical protein
MKKYLLGLQFLLVLMVLSISAVAQPGGDGDPGCDPVDPTCVPFDNGILFLIAIVMLIALKKAYDYKKSIAL